VKYIYFVSFAVYLGTGTETYFYREEIPLPEPVTSIEQLKIIERNINLELYNNDSVIITTIFYTLLRTEESPTD